MPGDGLVSAAMPAAGSPLPRSAPADQDVDPAAVLAFLDALEASEGVEMHSVMVVRHGHVVAEGWWSPYSPERKHLLYSISKSFTAAAAAFAQAEGLLHLDDTLVSHFPEIDADVLDPLSRAITLRHLASMASGHDTDVVDEAWSRDPGEPVRGFLLTRPDHDPGTVFAYNQPCTYSLAAVIQRRSGLSLTDYLRSRLFDPLGIGEVGWQSWPPGRQLGFTGLHARTEDVAKLGLLHLQRGRWGERQLLPEDWVAQATTRQIATPDGPNPDWAQGYGFQFWMARHGYRGDGAFGQFCVVLPEHDTVLATTACTEEMQAVLDAAWTHLLPGLGRAGRDPDAQARLDDRLAGLALPPCVAEALPADWEPWLSAPFATAADIPGTTTMGSLTAVAVGRDGANRPTLTLVEADDAVTVPVGVGGWTVSEPPVSDGSPLPLAASGGWWDDHTLRARVVFLETAHRVDVTLSLPERVAVASMPFQPLGEVRLARLRSP
jgi:CubicO group peptidase (beta-lactamase class C family)